MTDINALPVHLGTLGFARNPFPQTPDADCHFRTEGIKRQFTEALHCIEAGKGFVLLTGEVGTGKSTFLRCLMDELLAKDRDVAFVFNTFLQGRELLLAINRDFGLEPGTDLADDIDRLNRFLIERHAQGRMCVVVIDDAQNLDAASLELLRLLSNLETRQNKLLQIVLSGQPELLDVLATPGFRQLASRIVQHVRLAPLTRDECARYIDFRIARAGSDGRISLTAGAQRAAHRHALGNPRRVHLIMDRCLYGVMPGDSREIGKPLVDTAASEVGMLVAPRRTRGVWIVTAVIGLSFGLVGWAATRTLQTSASATGVPQVTNTIATVAAVPADVMPQQAAAVALAPPANVPAPDARGPVRREIIAAVAPPLALVSTPASPAGVPVLARAPADAATVPRSAPQVAPFTLLADTEGEGVRWVQIRLAELGHYSGPIDGVVGRQTLGAYAAFRRASAMPDSAEVDDAALVQLEHASLAARPATLPPAAAEPHEHG